MGQELHYTSVPSGLKPGSRGFCTVAMTQGMPAQLADQLESLSGYRFAYEPGSPGAHLNPVAFAHWRLSFRGKTLSVLSRVANAGADYSGRSNKYAHHVVVEGPEMCQAGPAWLMGQPGVMATNWSGEPGLIQAARTLPAGDARPGVCQRWQQVAGDAGWAGVLAGNFVNDPAKPVYVVYAPGTDVLGLFAEAMALLPPAQRWLVSFVTYFTNLPAGLSCAWRGVLAGTPAATEARRMGPRAVVVDLTAPLKPMADTPWTQAARTGQGLARTAETAVADGSPRRRTGGDGTDSAPPRVTGSEDGQDIRLADEGGDAGQRRSLGARRAVRAVPEGAAESGEYALAGPVDQSWMPPPSATIVEREGDEDDEPRTTAGSRVGLWIALAASSVVIVALAGIVVYLLTTPREPTGQMAVTGSVGQPAQQLTTTPASNSGMVATATPTPSPSPSPETRPTQAPATTQKVASSNPGPSGAGTTSAAVPLAATKPTVPQSQQKPLRVSLPPPTARRQLLCEAQPNWPEVAAISIKLPDSVLTVDQELNFTGDAYKVAREWLAPMKISARKIIGGGGLSVLGSGDTQLVRLIPDRAGVRVEYGADRVAVDWAVSLLRRSNIVLASNPQDRRWEQTLELDAGPEQHKVDLTELYNAKTIRAGTNYFVGLPISGLKFKVDWSRAWQTSETHAKWGSTTDKIAALPDAKVTSRLLLRDSANAAPGLWIDLVLGKNERGEDAKREFLGLRTNLSRPVLADAEDDHRKKATSETSPRDELRRQVGKLRQEIETLEEGETYKKEIGAAERKRGDAKRDAGKLQGEEKTNAIKNANDDFDREKTEIRKRIGLTEKEEKIRDREGRIATLDATIADENGKADALKKFLSSEGHVGRITLSLGDHISIAVLDLELGGMLVSPPETRQTTKH